MNDELNENMNNNQNQNNLDTNQNQNHNERKCFSCSQETKFWLRIFFFPCFSIYNIIACFWDERCGFEPYYSSYFFIDNIITFILSVFDLIFITIFKE